jgi:hypothetical protein
MKIEITFILLFITTASLFAQQNGAFSKPDKLLNIGIGVNSFYDGGIPIGASFEKGVSNNINVGVNADYLSFKFTAISFGVRAYYHVNELLKIDNDKIDLYGGPTLDYRNISWKDTNLVIEIAAALPDKVKSLVIIDAIPCMRELMILVCKPIKFNITHPTITNS